MDDGRKNARPHEPESPCTDILQDVPGDCLDENKLVHLIEKGTRTE